MTKEFSNAQIDEENKNIENDEKVENAEEWGPNPHEFLNVLGGKEIILLKKFASLKNQ